MNRQEKADSVSDLKTKFGKAKAVIVSDFRGMTVADITTLRFELKKASTDLQVVKNRLAIRALEGHPAASNEAYTKLYDYMSAVAFVYGDPSATAKTLTKFATDHKELQIKGGLVEGRAVSLNDIKALSKLPSRNELIAKLLGTLNAVPTGWVRVLNGIPSKWVYLLEAVRKQKAGE